MRSSELRGNRGSRIGRGSSTCHIFIVLWIKLRKHDDGSWKWESGIQTFSFATSWSILILWDVREKYIRSPIVLCLSYVQWNSTHIDQTPIWWYRLAILSHLPPFPRFPCTRCRECSSTRVCSFQNFKKNSSAWLASSRVPSVHVTCNNCLETS